MRKLREEGLTYREIAEKCGVAESTPRYHLNPRMKEQTRKSERKRRRKKAKEIRQYMRKYFRRRYHNDLEFRRKMIRANSGGKFKDEE